MEPAPAAGGTLERRLPAWCAALLGLAVAASVASVDYLPTNDGPQHVYTLHVAQNLAGDEGGWSRWYAPNAPVSNHGFTAVFAPLDAWLHWSTALRAALAVMTLVWVGGAFALARAVHPGRAWVGVALGAAALQWSLYMGFFSFYVATGVGLWVLAFAFGRTRDDSPQLAALAALLAVQALLHVMAAAVTGAIVAALIACRAGPGTRGRAVARIAIVGTGAGLVALTAIVVQHLAANYPLPTADTVLAPWWTLGKCFVAGPAWRAWPLTLLAAAGPVIALALGWGAAARAEDRALQISAAVLLAAAALLPLHLPTWDFFSVRFLPLAVCAGALALPLERLRPSIRVGFAVGVVAFAASATGWAFSHHRWLAERNEASLAGLYADIRRDGARLPIVLEPTLDPTLGRAADQALPFYFPLMNFGKLYATEQGGFVPYAFNSDPAIHLVLLREEIRQHVPAAGDPRYALELADPDRAGDLAFREAVTAYLAAHGTRYQDVILYGRPTDVDHLVWRGFVRDWQRGGLVIARFEGCPLRVHLPASPEREAARVLELGWYPSLATTHRYELSRAHLAAAAEPHGAEPGARVLPLRQTCGAAWIAFEDRRLRCSGADEEGRLVIANVREQPDVVCHVVRRTRTAGG